MSKVTKPRKRRLDMAQPVSVLNAQPVNVKDPIPKARWVVVSPDLATRWLEETNTNNRTVRDDYVARLASDMTKGKWRGDNGEAIRFDDAGRLVDGQHRLWACVVSQVTFETLLVEGVPAEAYATIGIGAKKSLADFLGPMGHEKNVHNLAALVRLIYMWQQKMLGNMKDGKKLPTIAELQDVLEFNPTARASADWISSHKSVRNLLSASYASLIHFAGCREGLHSTVEAFLERLGDGVGLEADEPVYQLRKFLQSQRGPTPGHRRPGKEYVLALAIKAWNMTKAGAKCRHLRIDETFPTLGGL